MTELWVERTGIRRYTGRSSRGAEVLIGSESDEAMFTPGELLKIALASDGLMVARGDLGVELGEAKLPVAERLIREVGDKTGRPVMLATEVMMSATVMSAARRAKV